jgi:MFS family permease
MAVLSARRAISVFVILAFGYFLSSVMRAVTGTLAPRLTEELALNGGQLGMLAGAYFLGFATMQLPLGNWLDHHGPRRVLVRLLAIAVVSCLAFAIAGSFWSLLLARLLGGVGVSACLMAALAGYRSWLRPQLQLRASAWMFMAGSFGLLAATLPVQWALPLIGWRMVFVALAVLFVLALAATILWLPRWDAASTSGVASLRDSYAPIARHAYFRRVAPLALINYAVQVAVQTLWAAQWMTRVTGYSALDAANGLFALNLTMLIVFWLWGTLNPMLARRGMTAERLMLWGLPLGVVALAGVAVAGDRAGWPALAAYCASSSFLSLAHPSVAMAFPAQEAGRAVSAFNLLLFAGAFAWQWLIGVIIDRLRALQWSDPVAFQATFGILALCCAAAYIWFAVGTLRARR